MGQRLKAIRGMRDILPQQMPLWHRLESLCAQLSRAYGFEEIRPPVLESTTLFKRSIGDCTDIVEKEMYTFEDRNGDSLSLRPEGTAGCVRAGIEAGLLYHQVRRLWYLGPMYRHERPQKGRYRQFYQWGVEAFGMASCGIDIELIAMTARLWQSLQLYDGLRLEINTLGTLEERQCYTQALTDFLKQHVDALDADSQRRLESNPLRVLDSKDPNTQAVLVDAPKLRDHLSTESGQHFQSLCDGLKALGIAYQVNPLLVRGLDYYSHTVFEWITDELGAQGTVCAGGRYDRLVEQLGGQETPAIGFAMGLERVIALMEKQGDCLDCPSLCVLYQSESALVYALGVAENIRDALPQLKVVFDHKGGSFKNQLRRADKSQARWALLFGDDELANQTVTIKPLREQLPQQHLSLAAAVTYLQQQIEVDSCKIE